MDVHSEVWDRIAMVGRGCGNRSRRGQSKLFLGEGLPACASASALLPAPATFSSREMSSICQDGRWHGLHVSRRSSPTPPRCCIPRTFFPPCQLLPAPLSFSKRKGTWEFEVNTYLVTRLMAEQ